MLEEDYEAKPVSSKSEMKGNRLIEEIVTLSSSEEVMSPNLEENQDETITTVLALLGSIMEMGSFQRDEKEEKVLRTLILPSLQTIASSDSDISLREMASDVALMIMVRGQNGKRKSQGAQVEESVKTQVGSGHLGRQ